LPKIDCRFCSYCKYYDNNLRICNDDYEASAYCPARRQFEEYQEGNRELGVNVGNLFIIKIPKIETKIHELNHRMRLQDTA